MKGKVLVHVAQASNEVILESTNGLFGGIAVVNVQWDELIVHIFHSKVVLKGLGCLVVKALELGAVSCSTEAGVDELVCLKDDFSLAILEWCN